MLFVGWLIVYLSTWVKKLRIISFVCESSCLVYKMSDGSDGQFSDYEEEISAKVKSVRVSQKYTFSLVSDLTPILYSLYCIVWNAKYKIPYNYYQKIKFYNVLLSSRNFITSKLVLSVCRAAVLQGNQWWRFRFRWLFLLLWWPITGPQKKQQCQLSNTIK